MSVRSSGLIASLGAAAYLILSAVAPLPLHAQAGGVGILIGVVRLQGGAPLGGATVRVEPSGQATTTDEEGGFRLDVPAGRDGTIVFSHPMTFDARQAFSSLAPGEVRQVAVTLVPLTLLVGQGRVRTLTVEVLAWIQAGQDPLAAAGALSLTIPPLLLMAGAALAIRRAEVVAP